MNESELITRYAEYCLITLIAKIQHFLKNIEIKEILMKPLNFINLLKSLIVLLTIIILPIEKVNAKDQTNIKTLVIVSHPYPDQSVLIKGLERAAKSVDGVTVRNLESIYGFNTQKINGNQERLITREYKRIVFIFPTHWFNITPMMKAYLNDTWGSVGPSIWQGKEMLIVTTAAGGDSTYGKSGRIGVSLADVFTPMKASALHAGMTYLPPLTFQSVNNKKLPDYQKQLIERLKK